MLASSLHHLAITIHHTIQPSIQQIMNYRSSFVSHLPATIKNRLFSLQNPINFTRFAQKCNMTVSTMIKLSTYLLYGQRSFFFGIMIIYTSLFYKEHVRLKMTPKTRFFLKTLLLVILQYCCCCCSCLRTLCIVYCYWYTNRRPGELNY